MFCNADKYYRNKGLVRQCHFVHICFDNILAKDFGDKIPRSNNDMA